MKLIYIHRNEIDQSINQWNKIFIHPSTTMRYDTWWLVGYTMRDIRYKWNEGPNSVGVSSEVSLPQFKVLGHRQRAMEISLTTGTCRRSPTFIFSLLWLLFSLYDYHYIINYYIFIIHSFNCYFSFTLLILHPTLLLL